MSHHVNRRDWIKWTGLLGGASLLKPLEYIENWDSRIASYNEALGDKAARLSYNENPFGPSQAMRDAMTKGFDEGFLYPGGRINELAALIAKKHGVEANSILVTAGSREGLCAAALTYASNGKEVIACVPTYKALLTYASNCGGYVNNIPLDKNYGYDLNTIEKRISSNTGMVFLCNPNNPTGTLLKGTDTRSFSFEVSKRTMVFSDEAYYDYITEPNYPSMIELVKEGHNVIVSRTFSKIYGLAGIRVGYLVARPEIISRIKKVSQASANILGVFAAKAALKEKSFYDFSLTKNNEAKEHVYQMCDEMGMEYIKSHTNFVFFKSGMHIEKLIPKMRDKGVMVGRPFPPFTNWCRISTGKMEDMHRFSDAFKQVMA